MAFPSDGSRKLPRRFVLLGAMSGMAGVLSGCAPLKEFSCIKHRERLSKEARRATRAAYNALQALGLDVKLVSFEPDIYQVVDPDDVDEHGYPLGNSNHPNLDLGERLTADINRLLRYKDNIANSYGGECSHQTYPDLSPTRDLLEETHERLVEQGNVDIIENFDVPTVGSASNWIDAWWDWSSP